MTVARNMPMSKKSAELQYEDRSIELAVIEGSEGERAVDINKLRDTTGLVTIDNGFMNTASTTSAVTFLDGEQDAGDFGHSGSVCNPAIEVSSQMLRAPVSSTNGT